MATIRTQPVIEDTGSQEVAQLRVQINELIGVLNTLIAAISAVSVTSPDASSEATAITLANEMKGDVNTITTAAGTANTSLASLEYIGAQPGIGLNPLRPLL